MYIYIYIYIYIDLHDQFFFADYLALFFDYTYVSDAMFFHFCLLQWFDPGTVSIPGRRRPNELTQSVRWAVSPTARVETKPSVKSRGCTVICFTRIAFMIWETFHWTVWLSEGKSFPNKVVVCASNESSIAQICIQGPLYAILTHAFGVSHLVPFLYTGQVIFYFMGTSGQQVSPNRSSAKSAMSVTANEVAHHS